VIAHAQRPDQTRRLTSTVAGDGHVDIRIAAHDLAEPRPHEVIVRIEAAPINPSDLIVMLADADPSSARTVAGEHGSALHLDIPGDALARSELRLGATVPVGNEGSGVVVAAGSSAEAQALLGATVAVLGGGTFAEHVRVPWRACMAFAPGTPARSVASAFVNPLTVLGMIDTMRAEGHTALVHTAAASNLGQMLVQVCARDGIGLVNVVRRTEQAELLRSLGAEHVCVSSSASFSDDLTEAVAATGATIAFDAVGGDITGQLLVAFERAARRTMGVYSPYGSDVHKQVYVYGLLDPGPVRVPREVGMAWGVGGWLLGPFLQRIGPDGMARLRDQVAAGIDTVFASHYSREVHLDDLLDPDVVEAMCRRATGEKYLLVTD
jgi:NADPH2:quinone reductase